MTGRTGRARVARETLEILERGTYQPGGSAPVSIAAELKQAKNGTLLYTPELLDVLLAAPAKTGPHATQFEVINCTTFAATRRRAEENPNDDVLCLNFASAKNAGGGFLGGAQAQEECLSRASGLYACIEPMRRYYDANKACGHCLYTEHLIYSPRVPVIRDDDDELLPRPYVTSIITSPAVNAGAVRQSHSERASEIEPTMRGRMERVLAVAERHGHTTLVLGAWGCGVFQNDAATVARLFHEHLTGSGRFAGLFRRVVFAVLDRNEELGSFRAFARQFQA